MTWVQILTAHLKPKQLQELASQLGTQEEEGSEVKRGGETADGSPGRTCMYVCILTHVQSCVF